jgi:Uri superfamily endonuclease
MKRFISLFAIAALMASTAFADDQAFSGVKVADAKGKQTDARLLFNDTAKNVTIRVADKDFLIIPYANIDKVSYDFTKKHRVTQGAVVMIASIGAGAIVMLTKSKSHWLYIDFHEQNAAKSVVLRTDKKEYENIISAVSIHVGKNVEGFGDNKKPKQDVAATKPTPTTTPAESLQKPAQELVEPK